MSTMSKILEKHAMIEFLEEMFCDVRGCIVSENCNFCNKRRKIKSDPKYCTEHEPKDRLNFKVSLLTTSLFQQLVDGKVKFMFKQVAVVENFFDIIFR